MYNIKEFTKAAIALTGNLLMAFLFLAHSQILESDE